MTEEARISDDFTFPIITNHNSLYNLHFTGFTPSSFWYASSKVADESFHGDAKQMPAREDFELEQKTHQRKSFSSVEGRKEASNLTRNVEFSHHIHADCSGIDNSSFKGDEEKMDMLWEDFNDEMARFSQDKNETERPKGAFSDAVIEYETDTEGAEMAGFCCVQALKMHKSSNMLAHRRPSMLVIFKILKKIFLIHHSHCPKKKSHMIY